MITFFSIPKAFQSHFGAIQKNAIKSWTMQRPKPEIVLFGNDRGVKKFCCELRLKHNPNIKRNEDNIPLLDSVFAEILKSAKNEILCFVLSDVILLNDINQTVVRVRKQFEKFLIIGQRYEADINYDLNFNNNRWKNNITEIFIQNSRQKGPTWLDYFIFTRGTFDKIPPFTIGRTFWDKWLVWKTRSQNINVIDATNSIIALHQTHDYSHAIGGKEEVWKGTATRENIRIAGGWSHGYDLRYATHQIIGDENNLLIIKHPYSISLIFEILLRKFFELVPLFDTLLLKLRLQGKNLVKIL